MTDGASTGPVLIFSSGRAGSTLLHWMLSHHPRLAWLPERLCNGPSSATWPVRAAMTFLDYPIASGIVRRLATPGEAYSLWERIAPGFSDPRRDLMAEDAPEVTRSLVRRTFGSITTASRRRSMAKITGWPRLGFLHACLPDADFVHIARDPRDVALSFVQVPWWRGGSGPEHWHWGLLEPEDADLWDRCGRTVLALSCIQLRIYWRALLAAQGLPTAPRLHHVRYDELCMRPLEVVSDLVAAIGLPASRRFQAWLSRQRITHRQRAWPENVTMADQKILEEVLAPCAEAYARITRRKQLAGAG